MCNVHHNATHVNLLMTPLGEVDVVIVAATAIISVVITVIGVTTADVADEVVLSLGGGVTVVEYVC
jgi:hypothetical protein